ncbi:hypothetical protein ACFWCA_06610 [Streptomyces phaeochromogenes]|uniref:hypothetical protein n=1 Tax=Streptomyces phaeochromogenes TaxID=1923 RepID=UPI00225C07F0|nr:hypothetical protein [Streptomyces phaeochromogenes]MCX5605067.1 hypothetical protein [Streptomyces phaeochromogenes]WRZ30903.1 hypothetical protein OG931_25765 [Streptomyces phaeochromogenes]WSJ06685.1 hypothetical protein OG437_25045 [Streptomyces phaeochromogenes]
MIDQQAGRDRARDVRLRWAGSVAFVGGLVVTLAFFGFFPGLPHVIDWGAVVVAVLVGALGRWVCQAWMKRKQGSTSR